MTESRIERYHQEKEKDRMRLSRMRCCDKAKDAMAKSQQVRNMEEILRIQQNVHEHSKRKLNRNTSLKNEHVAMKKQKVNEVRANVKHEVITLGNEATTFAKPRDQIVSDVKNRLSILS